MFRTLSLLILDTEGIFSIMTTSDVNHLVNGTPEEMVVLMMVFIVCRIALSKLACSIFVSLLADTKKDL